MDSTRRTWKTSVVPSGTGSGGGFGIPNARFREGQEDAIREVVARQRRLLVVRKTGWGKSFVYFVAVKLLREAGQGPALLISPLLSPETAAVNRENRNLLLEERLVLISPYDPAAGFNVGNAMQRNKLIYALADAALIVGSDYKKGGTWTGAIEQLQKYRLIPLYVRVTGETSQGLQALQQTGALPWPGPETDEDLAELLTAATAEKLQPPQAQAAVGPVASTPPHQAANTAAERPGPNGGSDLPETRLTAAEELYATVRSLIERMPAPKTEAEIADELNVSKPQAKEWLIRLVEEGVMEKISRPVRYRPATERLVQGALLGQPLSEHGSITESRR